MDIGYKPDAARHTVMAGATATRAENAHMDTTSSQDDRFEEAERGLDWLEKLEALQARSASDRAAYEVAEYVMKLRTAVTGLAGGRTAAELTEALGAETARLVEERRQAGDNDYWNTRIRPALLKSDP